MHGSLPSGGAWLFLQPGIFSIDNRKAGDKVTGIELGGRVI